MIFKYQLSHTSCLSVELVSCCLPDSCWESFSSSSPPSCCSAVKRPGARQTRPYSTWILHKLHCRRSLRSELVLLWNKEFPFFDHGNVTCLGSPRWCRRTWSQRRWRKTSRREKVCSVCRCRASESAGGTRSYWLGCWRRASSRERPNAPRLNVCREDSKEFLH